MEDLADVLAELRRRYEVKVAKATEAGFAANAHKQQEQHALAAMARARQDSSRPTGVGYTFTAVTDQEKGRVTDRNVYYRWALEQEPSIQEFLDWLDTHYDGGDHIRERLYEAILNLSILKVTEQQRVLNATVKACHDDERELPPGLDFEPVPYVSVTKA